jgi:urea transport system permease protein
MAFPNGLAGLYESHVAPWLKRRRAGGGRAPVKAPSAPAAASAATAGAVSNSAVVSTGAST